MNKNKINKILVCSIVLISAIFLVIFRHQIVLKTQTYFAIKKSVNYLSSKQLANGEFKTSACKNEDMTDCILDSASFTDSVILNSIQNIKIEEGKKNVILKKGIDFLLKNQEKDGAWHYWANKSLKKLFIPADIDDTVNASYVLLKNNVKFIDNKDIINRNKNKDGLFYTYIRDNHNEDEDIDCVININALLYLQNNDPSVCSYINESLRSKSECSPYYYPDKLIMYYFLSRAYANGISCMGDEKNIVISSVLEKQNKDGSFGNDLQSALAINTLLDIGYAGPEIQQGVSSIIKKQARDGFWENASFWMGIPFNPYNGSQELTTAISSEALSKYLSKL